MSMKNKWYMQPEMMVGFSALVVSLVAVIVSLYSASIDRDFARASVWPRVQVFRSFSLDPVGNTGEFKYGVANRGTGPALIKYARVSYEDRYFKSWRELIVENNVSTHTNVRQSHISTSVMPANFLIEPLGTKNKMLVQDLLKHDQHIGIELCYCSIYGECWIVDRSNVPTPIEVCKVDEHQAFRQ